MAVWSVIDTTLPALGSAAETRHIGLGPGLVEEDQPARIENALGLSPRLACLLYVGPISFARA